MTLDARGRALLHLEGRDEYRDKDWMRAAILVYIAETWTDPGYHLPDPIENEADRADLEQRIEILQHQATGKAWGPCPPHREHILRQLGLWPDPAKIDMRVVPEQEV